MLSLSPDDQRTGFNPEGLSLLALVIAALPISSAKQFLPLLVASAAYRQCYEYRDIDRQSVGQLVATMSETATCDAVSRLARASWIEL